MSPSLMMSLILSICSVGLIGCAGMERSQPPGQTPLPTVTESVASARTIAGDDARATAQTIAQRSIIVDTHIDAPYRLHKNPADISQATDSGEFDYPRARRGGLNAAFMSIYIPADVDTAGNAARFADEAIDLVEALATEHPTQFALATCTSDIRLLKKTELIALPMGMENGGPIAGSMDQLQRYFERGIRYITLAHSKSNHISDSSYDTNEAWAGLSPFGKSLIPAMNRLGVIIDVSHLSDKAFWQVIELSAVPVLATHSSLRHFVPDWQRNMDDAMLRALAAQGGVLQINFGSGFVTAAARTWSEAQKKALESFRAAQQLSKDNPEVKAFEQQYLAAHPYPFATLADVLDHIDHAVELVGIDHVGIGSDYDGVGDTLPEQLKDVASYPNLIQGLLQRGYIQAEIVKILGENTLRVWAANEAYAAGQGTATRCRL